MAIILVAGQINSVENDPNQLLNASASPTGSAVTASSSTTSGEMDYSRNNDFSDIAAPSSAPALLPEEPAPQGADAEFSTDFTRHVVPYSEILSGGPPKDGIPSLDNPRFVSVEAAQAWLGPVEPVIMLEVEGDVRAYPLQILMWHEIVNDVVGGVPVLVTFCPLCNTAIAFDRELDGQVLDFGTTGRLRYSNLIMYDRQTESWWQQASGEAIACCLVGRHLAFRPATMVSWTDFKAAHPTGKVLSRDTGFTRDYGQNPYSGYDNVNQSPFLYEGPRTPGTLPAMARVITVDLNNKAVAYPYDVLKNEHVINDVVGGTHLAVFWTEGTASALDAGAVADGRDVGSATVFSREVNGKTLTFRFHEGRILDDLTNSEWDHLGRALKGDLAGSRLSLVVSINHFWFSWAAFKPDTLVYSSP
ncbi:MAG TPA: DUF3179 domain-containing protein [Chloroflexia bacterium]|nr:DUF3179 domain-containing protein [Chloroflexia bacterium]